jgi:hypothetical protein
MIISSMNLYEFSQQNNREMGIFIDIENEEDKIVYEDAAKDIDSMIHNSEDFSYVKAPQKTSQSEIKPNPVSKPKVVNHSSSKLFTTKELSQLSGLSSRKVNNWLTDNKLMYKKEDDWVTTKRGKEVGGIEKSGQYGQFVIWPEEIGKQITE